MSMIKILLTFLIIYVPNALHFPSSFGIKGLNVFNALYLILFLSMIINKSNVEKKDAGFPIIINKALIVFYISLSVALFVSYGESLHFIDNLTIFKNVVTYSSLYFIVFHLADDKDINYYIKIVVLVVFVMSLEILREAISNGLGSGKRTAAAFGTTVAAANYAGVFFTIFMPFVLKIYVSKMNLFLSKYQSLTAYIFGVIAIFYTYSRQSYLSVLVTSLMVVTKKSKLLLVLFIIFLFNYQLWLPDTVIKRIEHTQSADNTGEKKFDNSTESRLVIWENAYTIILSNPGGIGLNEFQDKIDPYMPSWIHARDAHNQFVLVTTENGIVGVIALLYLIWACYRLGDSMTKKGDDDIKLLGDAYKLMVIAVVIGNLYSSTFYSPEVMGNFWILSALIARASIKSNMEAKHASAENI